MNWDGDVLYALRWLLPLVGFHLQREINSASKTDLAVRMKARIQLQSTTLKSAFRLTDCHGGIGVTLLRPHIAFPSGDEQVADKSNLNQGFNQ